MENKVDMTYRFTWDTEPTDEQLNALMREVGEDVRLVKARVAQQMREKLHSGILI